MDGSFQQANFDSDADHFIYCADGSTVQIDVLAKFIGGLDCDDECSHGSRTYTWTVTGATSYTIDSQTDGSNKSFITVTLSEAGDDISIQCEVSGISQGFCDEDRYGNPGEHGGNHDGATAACTIKLWRMDLDVTGGDAEEVSADPQRYWTTFADNVTTSATLVGASAISPEPNLNAWEWEATALSGTEELGETENVTSWAGKLVRDTCIKCYVRVVNGCDSNSMDDHDAEVEIEPILRRDGWHITSYSSFFYDETTVDDPDFFPGVLFGSIFWALNTNANPDFASENTEIVTPIYTQEYPSYYASFINYIDLISSGPNTGLFYNSDPGIFEIDRMVLLNKWITPSAGKPSTAPSTGPSGINYDNYLDIYTVLGEDVCGCASPSSHGGSPGNDIRYVSNKWHEGFGCPNSDNQDELGHHVRMVIAIETLNPNFYDPIWRADLLWAETESELRAEDEGVRVGTSIGLNSEMSVLHSFITSDPEEHNFYGTSYRYYNGSWSSVWGQWNNGW